MDRLFPLGFPFPTGFYLVFYVLTLAIHVLFMNYVLAGTTYLAVRSCVGGGARSSGLEDPKALVLRDWLPFGLGLTITAGVAPLLFVQVLYKQSFYTANLLGFHRWMSLLPVLVLGFYLLYVLKDRRRITQWPTPGRIAVGVGAFACVLWTGYSWTENHVLSRHAEVWPGLYASGSMAYWNPEILPRLALWVFGAFPTMSVILAWQLRHEERCGRFLPAGETRRTAIMALVGIGLSVICGGAYLVAAGQGPRRAIFSPPAWPYQLLAAVGLLMQTFAWRAQLSRPGFERRYLALASSGTVLTVMGVTVVREAVRLHSFENLAGLYPLHEAAFRVGGFSVFLVFFVVVAALIAWCMVLVRSGRRPEGT